MSIGLPKSPTSRQYEDLVSASLVALGHYVEARMRFVGNSATVSEFDVLATPSNEGFLNRILVEGRPEAWGYGDLFRLYGWRTLLGLDQARLVHLYEPQEYRPDELKIIANRIHVPCRLLALDGYDLDRSVPRATAVSELLRRKVTDVAWFAQISQRIACGQFALYCRQHADNELCVAGQNYRSALEASFVIRDPLNRLASLYHAYQECPNLTGRLVEAVSPRGKHSQIEMWEKLKDSSETLWLQYALLLEMKVRVAMVQSALEHLLGGKLLGGQVTYASRTLSAREFWEDVLPAPMREAITKISEGPYATRLPYALQSFIELFGGFFIERADEMELMATLWGVPREAVEPLLASFDNIFPISKGASWYFREKEGLAYLKAVPAFVRGAGCYLRYMIQDLTDYKKRYAGSDLRLTRWHTSLNRVLEVELRSAEPQVKNGE
jgi:hypothetical protein